MRKIKKDLQISTVIKLFEENYPEASNISEEFIEKMLMDIDISSATNKIEREVAGRILSVISENLENEEQAIEIQKHFSGIKFNRILNHLITARYFGYSCFEIVYNDDFTINTLVPIPYKYITYDSSEKKWKLKIGTEEVELTREKFLLCIHKWNPAKPNGKSIFESCKTSFLDKELYQNQLRGLSKKYGDVIIVFPFNENLEESEVKEIGKSVAEAKGKDVIGIPVNSKNQGLRDSFDFIKLSDLDPDVYTKLHNTEKEKLIQNILGSTLTLEASSREGKGTNALGEVHQEGFEQVVQEVCNFCIDSLYQLIETDSLFFGYNAKDFSFDLSKVVSEDEEFENKKREEEYKGLKIDNVIKLFNAGYSLDNKYLGEYIGIDYKYLIEKPQQTKNILEFNEDKEDYQLFNTENSMNVFETYLAERLDLFTKSITKQITEQILNLKEGDEFKLDLDYSLLEDDLILSQLKGYSNSRSILLNEVIEEFDPFNMKFEEAIKSFMDKTPVLYETIEEITEEVRANFVWLKKSTDLEITTRLFDNMKRSLENGTTFKQWLEDSSEAIKKAGLGNQGYYLENVYRTNMATQYSIGNYKQQIEVVEDFPYWEYRTIADKRRSVICTKLDGVIYRYDDPFWSTYYPPNHFHCRSTVLSRSKADIKRLSLKISKEIFSDDIGTFAGNPAVSYWDNIKKNAEGKQETFKWE